MRLPRTRGIIAVLAASGLLVSACSSGSSSNSASEASTTITVGAASSLTDVLISIGDAFTQSHPSIQVRFSFAASSAIAEQIAQGAPLDAFASAGTTSMQPVSDSGLVNGVSAFASNSLQIATPPGNPGGVRGLADLPRVTVVMCEPQVPCGVAAQKLFEANSLTVRPVSLEPDVRSVLAKVEADEADAGIVYVTDVKAVGDSVVGVVIPAEQNVTTTYQAAVVADSPNAAAAATFVAYLSSPDAQAALAAAGFAPAP